ncbi:MAG TPA: hypothetical protein VM219_09720 [Phycisphaerae bacterium]|nr:hypothetical protein [Phycisphaerae bacterium]
MKARRLDAMHRWPYAMLLAGLFALLGLWAWPCCAADDPPEEGEEAGEEGKEEDETTGGKDERVIVETEEHRFEPWRLPKNWRNEDGSFNQEAIVTQQTRRLKVLNQELLAAFQLVETKHYLIFSNADPRVTALFVRWCEALYKNLGQQFGIPATERVWDGKCVLMIFGTRSLFERHAREFDSFGAEGAGAYFAPESRSPDNPQLVHICIPLGTGDLKWLQEVLAHEGTHAFFQLYRKSVDLPRWLHEGLAEYMTVVNNKDLRREKQKYAIQHAQHGSSIRNLLKRDPRFGISYLEYNISYTLVEFLLRAGKEKFKTFVHALKDGKEPETALKEAYGWSFLELEHRWRIYVTKYASRGR